MKKLYLLLVLFTGIAPALANNVQLSNVTIVNGGPGLIQVQFDVSWDNSWRTAVGPANFDGAWVFFKFKAPGGDWTHVNLTGSNNVEPTGFDIYQNAGPSKTGAMIHRAPTNMGTGTVTATGIRLGVANTLPYNIDLRAFAIEMVFVPAGITRPSFGDGDGTSESPDALHYTDNIATTGFISPTLADLNGFDDPELDVDGIYVYSNDTIQLTLPLGALDPFPTMKTIWCMKYEINQAAYRDFLNTLDSQQQATRTASNPASTTGTGALTSGLGRNFIEIATPATSTAAAVYGCDANGNNVYNEAADGEWVACGFLIWSDVAAYLDWSGLAPMSELQFERMCRGTSSAGPNAAVFGEYAWGTTGIFTSSYTLSGNFSASEIATNASSSLGNAVTSSTSATGPFRSGIFAGSATGRVAAGASFYGIMEMTGNLGEYCIHLGSVAGRSCEFVPNGNGFISALGNAQLTVGGAGFWPGMEGNSNAAAVNTCSGTCEVISTTAGIGGAGLRLRGGGYGDAVSASAIANRATGAFRPTARTGDRGGRGVLYIR